MKVRLLTLSAFVLMVILIFPATAQATFYWRHVGGDPLVRGGVYTTGDFSYLMLNSQKVMKATNYASEADGLPSWVVPSARANIAKGRIYSSSIPRGTRVGAMSYGRRTVRVVRDTIYAGQYKNLPYFYGLGSKTTVVTINGAKYRQTVCYRVAMAKPCGNVFIFKKSVKRIRLYPLYVEKRRNTSTGSRLGSWQIMGKVEGRSINKYTSSTKRVLVGYFPAGAKISLKEVNKQDWVVVRGSFDTKMPRSSLTLRFINRKVRHKLYVRKTDASGTVLPGWTITGTAHGITRTAVTSTDPVLIAELESGQSYDLSEILQEGWEIVSPSGGRHVGTMPTGDLTLTFVNRLKYCPPPERLVRVYVEKRQDTMTGPRLSWPITGTIGYTDIDVLTSTTGATYLGEFVVGAPIQLVEGSRQDWIPVFPSTGQFIGQVPDQDTYVITFVNRFAPPPPDRFSIDASVEGVYCGDPNFFAASFSVVVTENSDNDAVTTRWTVDGVEVNPNARVFTMLLSYNTSHTAVVTARDAAGHTASKTLTIYQVGPGTPPPPD